MAAAEFQTVTLEAEHVPETHRTLENDHTVTSEELPGMVNVYVNFDGARLLLTQYKAGKVFDAIAARDADAAANPQPTTPTPEPTPTTQPTPETQPESAPTSQV